MNIKTRRKFIWMLNAGIGVLFLFLWNKLTLKHIQLSEQKEKKLPLNKYKKVSFFENYIVVNQNNNFTVLSSHCTHLGCKINKIENDKLICPCHGSEYDLAGKAIKGPAFKQLEKVNAKISSDETSIEIIS